MARRGSRSWPPNLAFDTDTIELPADVETTITLDNQDAGIQHNIGIYADDSLEEELFKGELATGPVSVNYTVPPLPAGEYYFQCDVHPDDGGHRRGGRRGRRRRW